MERAESTLSAGLLFALDVPNGAASPEGLCRRRRLPTRCGQASPVLRQPARRLGPATCPFAGCGPCRPFGGELHRPGWARPLAAGRGVGSAAGSTTRSLK